MEFACLYYFLMLKHNLYDQCPIKFKISDLYQINTYTGNVSAK